MTEQAKLTATSQSSSAEEEIAAAIALILTGAVAVPNPAKLRAIAALLKRAVPEASLEDAVALPVARLVVADPPQVSGATGAILEAHIENVLRRAAYGVQAVRRIAESVGEGTAVREALEKESANLTRHREASRLRVDSARMVDAAAKRWGPLLGWRHGHPKEPRPHHKTADGMNFRAGAVPAQVGAWPGELPGCTCVAVAPFENGRVMDG